MAVAVLAILAVTLIFLALHVWRAPTHSDVNRWFAFFTFAISGWVLGIAGVETGHRTEVWGRLSFATAAFIPAFFFCFSRVYPFASRWPSARLTRCALVVALGFAFVSLVTPWIAHGITRTADGIVRLSGPLYPLFAIYFVFLSAIALGVFLRKWYLATGLPRAQLQYLGIGLVVLAVGGTTTNLLIPFVTGRSPYSWLGPYFTLPLVLLVSHAIIRHRLLDIRLVLHRSIPHAVVILVITAIAIPVARQLSIHHGLSASPRTLDVVVLVFVVLVMLSSPIHRLLTGFVNRYLSRGRLDHDAVLRRATSRLHHLMAPDQLAVEITAILADTLVPAAAEVLVRSSDGSLELRPALDGRSPSSTGTPAASTVVVALSAQSLASLPAAAAISVTSLHATHQNLQADLQQAGIEIIATLGRRGRLLGLLLLGPRRSGDAYYVKDLSFLESLAELASIALENSLLYRQQLALLEYSERLIESLDCAVIAIDATGSLTKLNPAAVRLLSLDSKESRVGLESLPSEVSWALALALDASWHASQTEVKIDHPVLGPTPVVLSTASLHDGDNRTTGAFAIVTDISALRALERNQRRVEHLSTMARFYAGIAHEIRNPLTSISNLVALLPERFDDPEYRTLTSSLLPLEVARIVRLAERLKLMAPSEDGLLSPVFVSRLLADTVAINKLAAQDHKVDISLRCSQDLPSILGDRNQLMQLFLNLARNAIEAMPNGGSLVIEASCLPTFSEHASVRIRFIDDGQGISSEVRGRIFQPFFTTKSSGTGLGLSICKEIADFHHANLILMSRDDNCGTVAEVEFPVTKSRTETIDQPRSSTALI
jgi:signal transduction histidine kinase